MGLGLKEIQIKIKGKSPLLLHKYAPPKDELNPSSYKGEWKETVYLDTEGNVVMPSTNLRACLWEGCKGLRKGKIALTRVFQPSVILLPFKPLILFDERPITIKRIEDEGWVNISQARIKGSMVQRERAEIPVGWTIKFSITLNGDKLTANDLRSIIDNSGPYVGLGDWRPSARKPGAYGIFELLEFKSR